MEIAGEHSSHRQESRVSQGDSPRVLLAARFRGYDAVRVALVLFAATPIEVTLENGTVSEVKAPSELVL